MSEHARNLDIFMDGDGGGEYIPVVGDRVLLSPDYYHVPLPPSHPGLPMWERVGSVVSIDNTNDGDLEFRVFLDEAPWGGFHVEVLLDDIDTVYS